MPTRISGACNGCRAKKQKCSGDRAGCAQCIAAGIACTWPEQRKRGPAKGYIEGLEHRLHEAESLLLRLLPLVSHQQLETATTTLPQAHNVENSRASPERRSSPPLLNKKTGVDYWEHFPLDTIKNIRKWQADCEVQSQTGHRLSPARTSSRPPSADMLHPNQRHAFHSQPDTQRSMEAANALNAFRTQQPQPRQPHRHQPSPHDPRTSNEHSRSGMNPSPNHWLQSTGPFVSNMSSPGHNYAHFHSQKQHQPRQHQNPDHVTGSLMMPDLIGWTAHSSAMEIDLASSPKHGLVTNDNHADLFW